MENEDKLTKNRYEWKKWLGWYEESVTYFAEHGLDHEEERFIPYPLQMANGVRIMTNDAVFIFDEVGCGKTISAGIMAETFLYNQEEGMQPAEILVITTNTVKRLRQFQNDWKKIYPGLDRRVTVWNNLSTSDLKFLNKDKKWGMVIIDEAHEFCNTDTQKYNALKNKLRAEKIVFLTATPLRGGKNFGFYKELCQSILEKIPTDMEALDKLDNTGEKTDPSQLICAKFDPEYPVTRFLKILTDT